MFQSEFLSPDKKKLRGNITAKSGKQVVMISNFTKADHEFQSNCIRITDDSVCHGCWNNKNFKFDRGDWNWCPIWKGYDRQFECHNTIKAGKVIASLQPLIAL